MNWFDKLTWKIVTPTLSSQPSSREIRGKFSDNLLIMLAGMFIGFLFALPYNYYVLFKTGESCHKMEQVKN